MDGYIYYYNADRGFGFLHADKHSKVFFHIKDVDNPDKIQSEDTRVTVESTVVSHRGVRAFGVHVVSEE